MFGQFMIYGAYGYTGELVARRAVEQGLKPILAGRDPERLQRLSTELDLDDRVFQLEEPRIVENALQGIDFVVHCAGPFLHTFRPMSYACLATGTHYLDVTGEAAVFEALAARDRDARDAQVMLMPGVGFDVVPSDCLAAHLKRRLPDATHLTLGIHALGQISQGTAATMAENLHRGGLVRRDGQLTPVPAAWKSRQIDFGGERPRTAITMPWGDVSTAFHSTGIPNIEVYMALPKGMRIMTRLTRYFAPILRFRPLHGFLKSRIQGKGPGPDDEVRSRSYSRLWGEARNAAGDTVVSRLKTPEGYTLTAMTAVAIAQRVLAGEAPIGFQTPAGAYGPDLILEVEGVERQDEEP